MFYQSLQHVCCGGCQSSNQYKDKRRLTNKTADMIRVYMLEGGGQQYQFMLSFHPPIVGSALNVCQWDSKPAV
jgi:hypothetical protein